MKVITFCLLLVFSETSFSKIEEIKFSSQTISVGGKKLKVEIADTNAKTQRGLMHRKSLPMDQGMLFIFDEEEPRSFWMKNTFIPLEIGYFNKEKILIDIQEMQPVKSEMEIPKTYPSRGPAQYALEVNPGWFAKMKVKLGDVLVLDPDKRSGNSKK